MSTTGAGLTPRGDEADGPPVVVGEDDARLRAVFVQALRGAGFAVVEAGSGAEVLDVLERGRALLVLLDIGLPEVDGLEVLNRIRGSQDVPVIMVTGRSGEIDRVVGLEMGADDYVVKPVYPRELVARVRAVLRRVPEPAQPAPDAEGSLVVDRRAREVTLEGTALELTAREFDLLAFLAAHPRQTFTRGQLLEQVWGSSPDWQDPSTVTEHVRRVRNKLAAGGGGAPTIATVRSVGYRFEP